MSSADELRGLRRGAMIDEALWPENLLHQSDELVERYLPHRPPMLLIDELKGWNRDEEFIVASRFIDENHMGLAGHFPGDPVLPGTLLVEMLGQVGVVLFCLLLQEEMGEEIAQIRATKILGAHFLREIRPGARVDLVVRAKGYDSFLGECEAQALVDGEVAAVMMGEVMVA